MADVICDKCNGRGVVPRERRKIGTGDEAVVDPLDFQHEELCSKCGGSGAIAASPKPAAERRPGFVADQIGLTLNAG